MRCRIISAFSMIIVLICKFSGLATAQAVYFCDNDRVASQYPHCVNTVSTSDSKNGYWKQRPSESGDWNGDDRLGRSAAAGSYGWDFKNIALGPVDSMDLRVWLNNVDFTDPDAVYWIFAAFLPVSRVINQNTAPSGWWKLASFLALSRSDPAVTLSPPASSQTSVRAGADIIELRTFDREHLGPAARLLAMEDGFLEPSNCGSAHTSDTRIEAIQQRMLNSIDRYQDIKGRYQIVFKNNGQDDEVEFEISEERQSSYVKTISRSGSILEHKFDGTRSAILDSNQLVVRQGDTSSGSYPDDLRHYHNAMCEPVFVRREDPAAAHSASEVAFPQNYAFWLSDSAARIVGVDTLMGRTATVIEGRHDTYLEAKLGAATFKMWIDDDTGVLLKLLGSDERGAIVYFVEVKDIQFDRGVDATHFVIQSAEATLR